MTPPLERIKKIANTFINLRYLVVISSLVFFFVISIAFYMVYRNATIMRDQINDDFNQQQLILARQAASQIDSILRDLDIEIESLERLWDKGPTEMIREAVKETFERSRSKGVTEIGLIFSKQVLVDYRIEGIKEPDPEEIPMECGTINSGRIVLGPVMPKVVTGDLLTVTSTICAEMIDDELPGTVLFVKLDVTKLLDVVAHDIRSGKTGYAWIIDETGMFLYHPEKEFVGRNAFTVRQERKPYISFKQINRIMQDRMLNGEEGTGTYISGWHKGIQGEIKKLIAFTPVKSTALPSGRVWSVAVAAPISEVAGAVHRVYLIHFMAEAAIIAGMFVFGLLVAIYQQKISQALKERVKRTEADLHETERIYKRVVEQATDLIYILDLNMRIVLLNSHSIQVFSNLVITQSEGGTVPDDADINSAELYIGKTIDQLMRPSDAEFMRKKIDQMLENKSTISYEHWVTVKGRKVHLSTKLVPIRNDQREIIYILGISRDVTEKTELDQRIYNTEKLASIGTLAAGVAHEINNPLAIVLGFTDLLMEKFEPGSPEYEDLKLIETNSKNAKKVVENLLTFARITEGLEEIVDVKTNIDTVINIIKNTLMMKKVEMSIDSPENLPKVRGDSREFQQVLFNLINNSVAAMEKSGGKLSIESWEENGWVNVNISDTGIGIPERIRAHIFDPFFTTKKVGEGTGLGLSLCYGIVKKYGGRISFKSVSAEDRPGIPTGTTFTVSMPAYKSKEAG